MMIDPDSYYEQYLKGKTQEQIKTAIRGLKNEIGHLKNVMENPYNGEGILTSPDKSVRIFYSRLYLQRAKKALEEAGGTYVMSQAEQKVKEFEDNIPYISKVSFSIGGFHDGFERYTVDLTGEHLQMSRNHSIMPEPSDFEPDYPMNKEEFLDEIRELHIGEWRRSYTLARFGYEVLDGTYWEMEIFFSSEHKPLKIYGDNAYPYNFDKFRELFETDDN